MTNRRSSDETLHYHLSSWSNQVNVLLKKCIEESSLNETDTLSAVLGALEMNVVRVITAIVSCSSNPLETKLTLLQKVSEAIEDGVEKRINLSAFVLH